MNNMNTFAVLVFCIQALLIQTVFSQCSGSFGSDINNAALSYGSGLAASAPIAVSSGLGRSSAGFGYAGGFGAPGLGTTGNLGYEATNGAVYNGAGEGNVAVAGELPVAGNTAVFGHIPIQGSVSFGGNLPAAGFVTITGRCSCGCDNNY